MRSLASCSPYRDSADVCVYGLTSVLVSVVRSAIFYTVLENTVCNRVRVAGNREVNTNTAVGKLWCLFTHGISVYFNNVERVSFQGECRDGIHYLTE